ncbi:hypothetical protein JL721_12697 [Aureococcus anophagefferens]|nr:hypothetical protein JL721_12697 [Aureococcus anophagefferens]
MLGHLFLGHARYLLYMDAKIRLGALEDAWTLLYEELRRRCAHRGRASAPGAAIEGEWHLRDLADNRSAALGCAWFEEFARPAGPSAHAGR